MHELSIAMSILDIVASTCKEQGHSSVQSVRIRVGNASGIMTDSLVFSFDCAKNGTVAEGANLEIDKIPVGGDCQDCGSGFTVEKSSFVLNCPECGGTDFRISSGYELEIVELEVD